MYSLARLSCWQFEFDSEQLDKQSGLKIQLDRTRPGTVFVHRTSLTDMTPAGKLLPSAATALRGEPGLSVVALSEDIKGNKSNKMMPEFIF